MTPVPHDVVALVFDFDETLAPDATTRLLDQHGIDSVSFWKAQQALIQEGYDPTLAYLRLLLENVGTGLPLGELTIADLRAFGATLDSTFFPGLPEMFDELRKQVAKYRDMSVEFYIISGGLQDVIEGSQIVKDNFAGVYACRFGEGPDGYLTHVKRSVTFTEKTRYLFELNKGLTPDKTSMNPYLVNSDVAKDRRRIPFRNMVYVGDGLTDIPCFSLLKSMDGYGFGVFQPGDAASAKKAVERFLIPHRVIGMHAPRYSKDDELGALLRATVETMCAQTNVRRGTAEP